MDCNGSVWGEVRGGPEQVRSSAELPVGGTRACQSADLFRSSWLDCISELREERFCVVVVVVGRKHTKEVDGQLITF